MEKLLKLQPDGVNTKDLFGNSMLSYFAWNPTCVLNLLNMGANPLKDTDIARVLAIVLTSKNNRQEIITILRKISSVGVKMVAQNGKSLFDLCPLKPDLVNCLLELGVKPDGIGDFLVKVLLFAEGNDAQEILSHFAKAEIELVDKFQCSLLKYCLQSPELILCLIEQDAPTAPYTEKAMKVLVSQDKEHMAMRTNEALKFLASKGYNLVDEKGQSLLQYCKLQSTLAVLLRLGADPNKIPNIHSFLKFTLETVTAETCSDVKDILQLVAAAGVPLIDNDGKTLLLCCNFSYRGRTNVVLDCTKLLLKLGASQYDEKENIVMQEMRKLFSYYWSPLAIKAFDIQSVIEEGLNIQDEDARGCTIICYLSKYLVRNVDDENINHAWLNLLNYVINHPKLQDKNFNLSCKKHQLYDIMTWPLLMKLQENVAILKQVCGIFSNFKFNVIVNAWKNYRFDCTLKPANFPFLAAYISKQNDIHSRNNRQSSAKLLEIVDYFCAHGFKLTDPGVSPLAAAMILEILKNDAHEKLILMKGLIERGCNVEQQVVEMRNDDLQAWKNILHIPDVILLALVQGQYVKEIYQLLLPHMASPPLSLLLFQPCHEYINMEMFHSLLALSRVPHGTTMFFAIRDKVQQFAIKEQRRKPKELPADLVFPEQLGGITSQHLTVFDLAHKSPLTLLELSRHAVRMSLANTAAVSTTQSLPQLFQSLVPPGLNDELILTKIAVLRSSEDKILENQEEILSNSSDLYVFPCASVEEHVNNDYYDEYDDDDYYNMGIHDAFDYNSDTEIYNF